MQTFSGENCTSQAKRTFAYKAMTVVMYFKNVLAFSFTNSPLEMYYNSYFESAIL